MIETREIYLKPDVSLRLEEGVNKYYIRLSEFK